MKQIFKHIISIAITIGFLWYLRIVILNWQIVSEGNMFIGIIKIIIPLSANLVIYALLYKKPKSDYFK